MLLAEFGIDYVYILKPKQSALMPNMCWLKVEQAKKKRDGQAWSAEEQIAFKEKISSR